MHEKINTTHLNRKAAIYIRQSSLGQVKHNLESRRVQRRLAERAKELGWSGANLVVLEGDLGQSASQPGGREEFEELLRMVRRGEVGIILSSDRSRLARNGLDSQLLMHCCQFMGVVIGDAVQVYDPSLPEDSLMLGVQGAMASHESSTLRKRMEDGLREKASRGELHQGVTPRGFVVVEKKYLRKHPDRRAQQAIDKVFEAYKTRASLYELIVHLNHLGIQLPLTKGPGKDDVEWVRPKYESVRKMLQNPKYAGIYAYPLTKVTTEMNEDGELIKRTVPVPQEEWEVELLDNHPAYISVEQYEENQRKMAMNANRYAPAAKGAPQEGPSLITGLVYCHRCGHRMTVEYPSQERITYACNKSGHRHEGGGCGKIRMRVNEMEDGLCESILYTVSPAGMEAAELAAQLIAQDWNDRRQVHLDACEHERYHVGLARRRIDNIDPEHTLVYQTLTGELEEALRALQEQEAKLQAFDRDEPQLPTPEQKAELHQLGQRVSLVWKQPRHLKLKKQIVRTLIKHITADVDEETGENVFTVQWAGGQHTELREPRHQRRTRIKTEDLKSTIITLAKVNGDEAITRTLNRLRVKTERNETWSPMKVKNFRERNDIPAFDPKKKKKEGWMTQQEAATYLGISPMSLNRLIDRGIIPAERHRGMPCVICLSDVTSNTVKTAVSAVKNHGNAPLPEDPDQLSLLP